MRTPIDPTLPYIYPEDTEFYRYRVFPPHFAVQSRGDETNPGEWEGHGSYLRLTSGEYQAAPAEDLTYRLGRRGTARDLLEEQFEEHRRRLQTAAARESGL